MAESSHASLLSNQLPKKKHTLSLDVENIMKTINKIPPNSKLNSPIKKMHMIKKFSKNQASFNDISIAKSNYNASKRGDGKKVEKKLAVNIILAPLTKTDDHLFDLAEKFVKHGEDEILGPVEKGFSRNHNVSHFNSKRSGLHINLSQTTHVPF